MVCCLQPFIGIFTAKASKYSPASKGVLDTRRAGEKCVIPWTVIFFDRPQRKTITSSLGKHPRQRGVDHWPSLLSATITFVFAWRAQSVMYNTGRDIGTYVGVEFAL